MEIHFIWIKEFNSINEQGINLSSKFIFKLDVARHQSTLTIKFNENFIENFFNEKNVTDVCAIIGKNGVGKSTVLKYIKENLPDGLNSKVRDDVFVYSLDNEFFISYPKSLNLEIVNKTDISFCVQPYERLRFSTQLGDADYIYYNYLLDFNEDITNYHGLKNISTTSMLLKERRRILDEVQPIKFLSTLLHRQSDLDNLHMLEVYQSVVFITNNNIPLPFDKPKSLKLKIDIVEKEYFTEERDKYTDILEIIDYFDKLTSNYTSKEEIFISNLWYAIFINFLITDKKYSSGNPYSHVTDINSNDSRDSYIERFFKTMKNASFIYQSDNIETEINVPKLDNLSRIIPEFISLVHHLIYDGRIIVVSESEAFFQLGKASDLYFKEFQNLYVTIRGLTHFIQFKWHSLSSGEQSYLSFMSRFYYLINEETIRLKKDLVILIDEGDTAYHPEWQRKFFKNTLEYLSSLFGEKKIQLIFTSNTPFLTSDLPQSKVLFVNKKNDGSPDFLDKEIYNSKTFAGNIHTLFSDSFYMDGMLIGEYAKDKINEIILYLNDEKEVEENDLYKRIIDCIGEDILRKKLQDMWFEKFGLAQKLEILKKQVAEIEHKLIKKNDTDSL